MGICVYSVVLCCVVSSVSVALHVVELDSRFVRAECAVWLISFTSLTPRSSASMVLVGTITRAEGSAWLSQPDVTKDAPVASAPLKRSLVTITEQIPLEEFHLLIISLRCNELFVVREGRLLGAVSRQRYKATLARLEKGKHSLLHCMGLC